MRTLFRVIGVGLCLTLAACDGGGSSKKRSEADTKACMEKCVDKATPEFMKASECVETKGLAADCGAAELKAKYGGEGPEALGVFCAKQCK